MFYIKKTSLKISQYSQEKICGGVCDKVEKRLQHRCFPVNIAKVSSRSFLQKTSGRLLLKIESENISSGD